MPALTRALDAEERTLRHRAAEALGLIGPAARSAIPALIMALDDENGQVRASAAEALERLHAKP